MWKGWLPSVIGVIPYVGLNFAVYETLKDSVLKFYGAYHGPKIYLQLSTEVFHNNSALSPHVDSCH